MSIRFGVTNDACVDAIAIPYNTLTSSSTVCATPGPDDPTPAQICAITIENTVWHSFMTPTTENLYINVSNISCFSGSGIQFGIVTGGCGGPYTSVNCANGSNNMNFSFTATGGTTYYLVIDGVADAQCVFDILISPCSDAGNNTSPAMVEVCANSSTTDVQTVGAILPPTANSCIVWGLWVQDDPLGVHAGMTNIGDLPTGGLPANDPNFAGLVPGAMGSSPTITSLNDGVTYYIAPITASNCNTSPVTIDPTCFDVGNATSIYFNPAIVFNAVLDCDNSAIPTVIATIAVGGGLPSIDGSDFTLTNNGDGVLSVPTIGDGGQFTVSGIPDGGSVNIVVTDDNGCSRTITINNIDAASYCPACAASTGTNTVTQTGQINRNVLDFGLNDAPFILCYGDQISLELTGVVLPPVASVCTGTEFVTDAMGTPTGTDDCVRHAGWAMSNDIPTSANPENNTNATGWGICGSRPRGIFLFCYKHK
jgi:hypothetical protein